MIGEGPTCCSNASRTFEGHAWSFWAYRRPFVGIKTDNASSSYSITWELQSTLESSVIQWPALKKHIPGMAHVIQLALGAFMSSLGVKGRTKSWEAHEGDRQFGENGSIEIGMSRRLGKEGNARINKVPDVKPGLAKIIEKVRISWYFGSPEIDIHIAENACCIYYADTLSSKRVHWLSKGQRSHRGTTDCGWKDTVEVNTGVAQARLPIMGIHTWVAQQSKILWLPATFHNSKSEDHGEVCHGSIEAISILDPVDFKDAYSHIASRCHSVRQHVESHGRRDASIVQKEDSMDGRRVLRCG